MSDPRHRDSGLSPEADQALDVLTRICGGERYVEIVKRDVNWIEVETFCTDDEEFGGRRRVTIGIDGRVMHS